MSEQLSPEEKRVAAVANLTVVMRNALIRTDDGSVTFSGSPSMIDSLNILGIGYNKNPNNTNNIKTYTGVMLESGDMGFSISKEAAKALSEAGVRTTALDRYLPKQPAASIDGVSSTLQKSNEVDATGIS